MIIINMSSSGDNSNNIAHSGAANNDIIANRRYSKNSLFTLLGLVTVVVAVVLIGGFAVTSSYGQATDLKRRTCRHNKCFSRR
jgi:hypothetical protein